MISRDTTAMAAALSVGLPACWQSDARVLILGSLPGVASLQAAQYYAHPRNQFWPMMQQLFGVANNLPYVQRIDTLQQAKVALWDLIAVAERRGSLDSAIRPGSVQLNDLATLLQELPDLRAVWLNGTAAAKSWQQLCKAGMQVPVSVQVYPLPSTSPAHAAMSFAEKLILWQRACHAIAEQK